MDRVLHLTAELARHLVGAHHVANGPLDDHLGVVLERLVHRRLEIFRAIDAEYADARPEAARLHETLGDTYDGRRPTSRLTA